MNDPVPYNLKPKATKLPEGPDDSLEPAVDPVDAEARGVPPTDWAAVDLSKGGDGPPDAPLAPPATDAAVRGLPPFDWPRPVVLSNRAMRELGVPVPDLDPDVTMWPVTPLQRWPFTGHPVVGIWPRGWLGVDNTAAVWVCTASGEPGTWTQVGAGGGTIPGGGDGMPISNPTGITTGLKTPDPIAGADTQLWVEFPSDASVMAWGLAGDAFPRVVFGADPTAIGVVALGDGTFDPTDFNGAVLQLDQDGDRGFYFNISGGSPSLGALLGTHAFGSTINPPNSTQGGQLGDFLGGTADTDSGAVQHPAVWRCVTSGDSSTAVWVLVAVVAATDPITAVFTPPNAGALWQDTSGSGSLWMSTGTSSGDWTQIGGDSGWVDASGTLVNSWTVSSVVRYRKLNGVVYVDLGVSGGSNVKVLTLPAGFRPLFDVEGASLMTSAGATSTVGIWTVNPTGDVNISLVPSGVPVSGSIYAVFIAEQ